VLWIRIWSDLHHFAGRDWLLEHADCRSGLASVQFQAHEFLLFKKFVNFNMLFKILEKP